MYVYVIMSVTHELFISHGHMHNTRAHALSSKSNMSKAILCIERTPQRASHFLPVWLDQH